MNKITKAIEVMAKNPDRISSVVKGKYAPEEYYFIYDNIHKWSIGYNYEDYFLVYYASKLSLEILSEMPLHEWQNLDDKVLYNDELHNINAMRALEELYASIKGKLFNMDDILNSIIG